MRAVVQRVTSSAVQIGDDVVSEIQGGLLVLLGVAEEDGPEDTVYMVNKLIHLRIFEDGNGKMNRSLVDVGGEMLVVSQFTLLGDCRKGRRPSFVSAASPEKARRLYNRFVDGVRSSGVPVKTGRFQAMMSVSLVNHGPVTLILDSREGK